MASQHLQNLNYYVVTGVNKQEFCAAVTAYLQGGWQLQGGVSISTVRSIFGKDTIFYSQTIIPKLRTTTNMSQNIAPVNINTNSTVSQPVCAAGLPINNSNP